MIQPIHPSDYCINYSSAVAGINGNIVLPDGTSELCSVGSGVKQTLSPSHGRGGTTAETRSISNQKNYDDEGVVITPEPSGIVIKTRLFKDTTTNPLLFEDDYSNNGSSSVPPSFSNIAKNIDDVDLSDLSNGIRYSNLNSNGDIDTKVFLNICTHPLIATPGLRKTLEERTGKEIDGWRLPMSMGELRPCYDKTGHTAIAADCILNPQIVKDMNADANHFHFVCDLVVQCANRKFGRTWFGGSELDRRFKLPKMRYAGYVDERTGHPIVPDGRKSVDGAGKTGELLLDSEQHAVVAKQRVKGNGGRSPIIEEIDTSSSRQIGNQRCSKSDKDIDKQAIGMNRPITKVPSQIVEVGNKTNHYRIELYIGNSFQEYIPLFKFLKNFANQKDTLPTGRTLSILRNMNAISALDSAQQHDGSMKDEAGFLHESQLLKIPLPFDIASFSSSSSGKNGKTRAHGGEMQDSWSILAKCTIHPFMESTTSPSHPPTTVGASAYLLVLSSGDEKTECVLPFPIDTMKTTCSLCRHDSESGTLEIHMPLVQSALQIEEGPDPGTSQWNLQCALTGKGGGGGGESNDFACSDEGIKSDINGDESNAGNATRSGCTTFSLSYLEPESEEEEEPDDEQPLPEDTFHSRDVLSRHMLQQQEEERKARKSKPKAKTDEDNDVEYIDVEDFLPGGKYHFDNVKIGEQDKVGESQSTLKKAESTLKQTLQNNECMIDIDLVLGLV